MVDNQNVLMVYSALLLSTTKRIQPKSCLAYDNFQSPYFATFQSGQEKKKVLLLFIYTCRDKSVLSKLLKQKTADEPIKQHKTELPHTETPVGSKKTDIHNNLQLETKGNSSD